jgi:hypothetical protein
MSRQLIAAAVLVGVLAGASAAAVAAPRWETVPVTKADDHFAVLAAGRVWFFNNGTADTGRFITKSARVVKGGLSSWVTGTLGGTKGWVNAGLLGQDLIFSANQAGLGNKLWAVALRPDGTLGKPRDVLGAPTPASSGSSPVVRLRDRPVELVDACDYGVPCPGNNPLPHLGACCDVGGNVSDLSSIAPPSTSPVATLGLDRRGRLWLAWTPYVIKNGNRANVVELDTKTLEPRGKPLAAPSSLSVFSIVDLACTDICRLVMEGASRSIAARNFSWAPGERSPTPISPPGKEPGGVIGVRADGNRLLAAYSAGSPDHGNLAVRVARGDKRGRNLRLVSSIAIPPTIGSFANGENLTIGPVGTFGSGGFAAVAVYEQFSGGNKVLVRVAILPLH